jgi:hypothetical protein
MGSLTSKSFFRVIFFISLTYILMDLDECETIPCLNHATCSEEINGYTRHYASGFIGE